MRLKTFAETNQIMQRLVGARWLAWICVLWAGVAPARAHQPSNAYLALTFQGRTVEGQWDIALRDLEYAIGLDANDDGVLTWGEVRARQAEIAAYALARLDLKVDGKPLAVKVTDQLIADHPDGGYAVVRFVGEAAATPGEVTVGYHLFSDLDPLHRGLFQARRGGWTRTAVFGPERPEQTFQLEGGSRFSSLGYFVAEGVRHIWQGYDHLMFLLALLLPAVLVLSQPGSTDRPGALWVPSPSFRPALWSVAKVVTAFTVAHSLTLTVATLGWVRLPSRLVESCIAASVIAAACNNLRPWFRERGWVVAFGFGLIHGFGFASVLSSMDLPRGALAVSLFGFNLGVEIGQLSLVLMFLPLAYAARRTLFYRRFVLQFGSAAIALTACAWLIERGFDLRFMPF